jgi:lipoate-protein ligase B
LILLQHPPTYTLGARGDERHLLLEEAAYARRGAEVVRCDRGGDVTFHGPGQVVGYPILDLRALGLGPVAYVRGLEQTIIGGLATFGLTASRIAGRPGVWAGNAKIASIGVRIAGGVSTHGFALNVTADLGYFRDIVPCGLPDIEVTSMEREGVPAAIEAVEDALIHSFSGVFDMEPASSREYAGAAVA